MIEEIKKLYDKYSKELEEVKNIQKQRAGLLNPHFDDIESELLYMSIREVKPEHVVEFSPMEGWSTSWILEALNRNGKGKCVSYDLTNNSQISLSKLDLNKERWKFIQGDVEGQYSSFDFESIDFLFIDSDHSVEFAEKYVAEVLSPAKKAYESKGKDITVFIHDIFGGDRESSIQEGSVIKKYLSENNINFITPSSEFEFRKDFDSIRANYEFSKIRVHWGTLNPVVVFRLGASETKPAKKINRLETKYSNKLEPFNEFGFFVVENFFSELEVERNRALCDNYFDSYPSVQFDGGKVVPGWAGKTPEMEELNNFHEDPRILEVARSVLGDKFVFAEHADLHQNKGTGWHRDTKDFERGGGTWPNWSNDFLVIKVAFLLQDHTDNDHGMWMEISSHKEGVKGDRMPLRSKATDLIVFDQRIHHKGSQSGDAYKKQFGKDRYLITYGYGVDNELTKKHIAGCKKRQDKQRESLCMN